MSNEQMLKDLDLWLLSIKYDFNPTRSAKAQELEVFAAQKELLSQWELALKALLDRTTSDGPLHEDETASPQNGLSDLRSLEESFELTLSWAAHHHLSALIHALIRYCLPNLVQIRTIAKLTLPKLQLKDGQYAGLPLWAWVIQEDNLALFEGLLEQCNLHTLISPEVELCGSRTLGLHLLQSKAPKILDVVIAKHRELLTRQHCMPFQPTPNVSSFHALDYVILSLQAHSKVTISDETFKKLIPLMLENPYLSNQPNEKLADRHYIKHLLNQPQDYRIGTALQRAFALLDALSEEKKPKLQDLLRQLDSLVHNKRLGHDSFVALWNFFHNNLDSVLAEDYKLQAEGSVLLLGLRTIIIIFLFHSCPNSDFRPVMSKILSLDNYFIDVGDQPGFEYSYNTYERIDLSFFEKNVMRFIVFATELKKNTIVHTNGNFFEPKPFAEHIRVLLSHAKSDEINTLLGQFPKIPLAHDIKQNLLCFVIQSGLDNWLEPLLKELGSDIAVPARQGLYNSIKPETLEWGSRKREAYFLNCFGLRQTLKGRQIAGRIRAQASLRATKVPQVGLHSDEHAQSSLRASASPEPVWERADADTQPLLQSKQRGLKNA